MKDARKMVVFMGEALVKRRDPCRSAAGRRDGDRVLRAMREPVPAPLKRFIWDIQSMVELAESEREILLIGGDLMSRLVASDDWLPPVFASPDEKQCRHYQLYRDDLDRFSVVGTVLGTGQAMEVRQDKAWEIFGLLRGSIARSLPAQAGGAGKTKVYNPGSVGAESSSNGKIRRATI